VDKFTVVHSNGIHTVKIWFCACYGDRSLPKFQLLRCSWLPASREDPQTAVTFDVLHSHHLILLQGKVSQEDYYISISRLTDNTGNDPPKVRKLCCILMTYTNLVKDRYLKFFRAVWMWEHLKLLKRSGRGHKPEGVDGTKPGQCAVECAACPEPK
jgi:hypothetical protein